MTGFVAGVGNRPAVGVRRYLEGHNSWIGWLVSSYLELADLRYLVSPTVILSCLASRVLAYVPLIDLGDLRDATSVQSDGYTLGVPADRRARHLVSRLLCLVAEALGSGHLERCFVTSQGADSGPGIRHRGVRTDRRAWVFVDRRRVVVRVLARLSASRR